MELGQRYSCPSKLDFGHTSVTPRSGSVQHNSIFNLSEGAPVETSGKCMQIIEGFSYVRESLLQTSQMIKDIDEFLTNSKIRKGDY